MWLHGTARICHIVAGSHAAHVLDHTHQLVGAGRHLCRRLIAHRFNDKQHITQARQTVRFSSALGNRKYEEEKGEGVCCIIYVKAAWTLRIRSLARSGSLEVWDALEDGGSFYHHQKSPLHTRRDTRKRQTKHQVYCCSKQTAFLSVERSAWFGVLSLSFS